MTRAELMQATLIALATPPRRVPKPEPKPGPYLLFYSADGEFTLKVYDNTKHWDGTLEWSTDAKTWAVWLGNTTLSSSGGYLYLRGSWNSVITGASADYRWVFTGGRIECIGNIENLLDYDLVAAGEHPEMAIACYFSLFSDCTSLTTAPELPATTLANYCYASMFSDCTSLTTAPELPAVALAYGCYTGMFSHCLNLIAAPELPATTLANYCYASMFSDCTSLTTAPELPATTLANYCYQFMFGNCSSLTTAPKLPATTLAPYCYYSMFYLCTRLVTVPELPATTLANHCYASMFYHCDTLRISSVSSEEYQYPYRIPTSGTGTGASFALDSMFYGIGGPFTGTPTINTTYYTDHEPV